MCRFIIFVNSSVMYIVHFFAFIIFMETFVLPAQRPGNSRRAGR